MYIYIYSSPLQQQLQTTIYATCTQALFLYQVFEGWVIMVTMARHTSPSFRTLSQFFALPIPISTRKKNSSPAKNSRRTVAEPHEGPTGAKRGQEAGHAAPVCGESENTGGFTIAGAPE
jgi:hypothetical protein